MRLKYIYINIYMCEFSSFLNKINYKDCFTDRLPGLGGLATPLLRTDDLIASTRTDLTTNNETQRERLGDS